jgi:hypothetical protein
MGGRSFPVIISKWNSCTASGQIAASIEGFKTDNQVMVLLKAQTGKEARATATFRPVIVTLDLHENKSFWGLPLGSSRDFSCFNVLLKNDWYVVEVSGPRSYMDGHAELKASPRINVPNVWSTMQVHAGVAAFGYCAFDVYETIAGPKGLPYK